MQPQTRAHPEVVTLAAEAAFATANYRTARSIVEEFLQKCPQRDQFFCRQKIILGLLINIESEETYGGESILQRKRALSELIVALQVATRPDNRARYEFVVFNVSVEAWKIIRPFLRTGRAKFFVEEITSIATSLQTLRKVDKDWLTTFYGGTAFCMTDHGDGKGAAEILDKAIILAQQAVEAIVQLETADQVEITRLSSEVEEFHRAIHSNEAKLDELLVSRQKRIAGEEDPVDDAVEEAELREALHERHQQMRTSQVALGSLKDTAKEVVERKAPLLARVVRLFMQRIHAYPEDAKRFAGSTEVVKTVRVKCLAQLHCMQAGCVVGTECLTSMKAMIAELEKETPSPQVC